MFYNNDLFENCLKYSPGIGPRPYARIADDGVVSVHEELDFDDYARFALRVPFWRTWLHHSYFYTFVNFRVYQRLRAAPLQEAYNLDRSSPDGCDQYPILFHMLDEIAAKSAAAGSEFALAMIPDAYEVADGRANAHDRILEHCAAAGHRCLSLVDALGAAIERGQTPYFDADIHWTKDGHAVAADALESFVGEIAAGTADQAARN